MRLMDKLPLVSIIVPVYNAEKYLSRCVESILKQENSNFELLLVDDGSIDKSLEICRFYYKQDKRVNVIQHEHNRGVSEARNTGLSVAKGKWIAFVDADDSVTPDWLSGCIGYDNNSDLITHPVRLITPNKWQKEMCYNIVGKTIEENILNLYRNHLLGFIWSMFFNRDTIEKHNIRFDKRLQSGEDLEFMSRYSNLVTKMDSFYAGYYIYTFPMCGKTYGKVRNVYFLVYSNLCDFFSAPILKKGFIEEIAPNLIQYILKAYSWNEKIVAQKCIKYYRKKVSTSFFLRTNNKVALLCNIFIKLNAVCLLKLMAKIKTTKKYDNGFEYIEF